MQFSPQLSVGDKVRLSGKGAKAHREHHIKEKAAGVAVAAAVATPVLVGGGIGVAVGGGAFGVGATAQAAAGGAAGVAGGAAASALGSFPEGGATGKIIQKRKRWWGKSGHDYEVKWDDEFGGGSSWHLSKHLERLC
jgi:hypothetical protein